jgi:hypothetical protein
VKKEEIIQHLAQWGKLIKALGENQDWTGFEIGVNESEYANLQAIIQKQFVLNGWFTEASVRNMLFEIGSGLTVDQLNHWTENYSFSESPKRIGIIMAGNIPMVGFHDFLCVVISGNKAIIKLSSDDKTVLPALLDVLVQFDQRFSESFSVSLGKLGEVDAMIATGSNNSMNYFEQYFGHLPHIFRKNRTSIAILDGSETPQEIALLGKDIFTYFGLGCRNVSQIFIPADFELNRFFEGIYSYFDIVNHHKYANNYDYNKAIHLMNQEVILDNGFVLLKESMDLFSPLAMLFYQRYSSQEEIEAFLKNQTENIQAIVSKNHIPFGNSQSPRWSDYADHVDTMQWLDQLITHV